MPFFCKHPYAQADPHAKKPVNVAVGRDQAGEFKTAKHKEYPEQFCKGLAHAIVQTLKDVDRHRAYSIAGPVPIDLCDWLHGAAKASTTFHRDTWMPDYQGQ